MKHLMAILCMTLSVVPALHAQKEAVMANHAKGTFDVKLTPPAADDAAAGPFGRLFINKQFHGELDGTSNGQMMALAPGPEGSGAYVALERVSGTLNGRRGSFVLQHSGTMTKGVPTMSVTVVPDSGTEQLTGMAGKMTIVIADGKHSYEIEYTLAK